MKRVVIVGCCGAGKSVFAKKLHVIIGLPLYHLDRLYWAPDWVPEDNTVFEQRLHDILRQDAWIMDGNYTRTIAPRLERADIVFFFDFPVWFCLQRIIKRGICYWGETRDDMAIGCREGLRLSFLLYVVKFRKQTRLRILEALDQKSEYCDVVVFQSDNDVKEWLNVFEMEE